MKVSIQRQCDGLYADDIPGRRCDARIELSFEVVDRIGGEEAFVAAWESAAREMGWRRLHGPGHVVATSMDDGANQPRVSVFIPSTKVWVACDACSHAMRLVPLCNVCGGDRCLANPSLACENATEGFDARMP